MINKPPVSIGKTSAMLGLFALLAALLLGSVNLGTADRIQQQQLAAQRRALDQIFPPQLHNNDFLLDAITLDPALSNQGFIDIEALQLSTARQAFIARQDGVFAGVILPAEAHDAYSGDILFLAGILADGSISGVRVLEHRETPGLGDKIDIEVSDWILGFDGKSLSNLPAPRWQVVKDGGDFDQLIGATITSRALINQVLSTLEFFNQNKAQFDVR